MGNLVYESKYSLAGISKSVSRVLFSPCGRWIGVCCADSILRVYNAFDGKFEKSFGGHKLGLSDLCWTLDSKYVITASDDKTLKIWDFQSGKCLKTLRGHSSFVFCCSTNPQCNLICSGSFDESVIVWDIKSGRSFRTLPAHSDPVSSVKFIRDGSLLLSSSLDGLCRIWDTNSGQCLRSLLHGDNPPVSAAIFSPNGRYVLSATMDSRLKLWDLRDSKVVAIFDGHVNKRFCLSVVFEPFQSTTEQSLYSASEDGAFYVWDLGTRKLRDRVTCGNSVVMSVDCHPNVPIIASGSLEPDKTVQLWHL